MEDCIKDLIINPDFSESWYNKGVIFTDIGQNDKALESYDKALQVNPEFYEALYNEGLLLLELGNYRGSLELFDKALLLKPKDENLFLNKGNVLSRISSMFEALHCFEEAIEIKPNFFEAWSNEGVILAELGQNEEALEAFDKAIDFCSTFAEAFYNKAIVYLSLKKSDSLKYLNRAIEINQAFDEAWYVKGKVLLRNQRFPEALKAFDSVIKINPEASRAWYNKGIVLLNLNKQKDAVDSFRKALKIDPYVYTEFSQDEPFFSIIPSNEELNMTLSAGSVLRRKLDKYINSISFSSSECIKVCSCKFPIFDSVQRYRSELNTYNKSIVFSSNLAEAWYNKGNFLTHLGRKEEALKAFDKSLEINPENPKVLYKKGAQLFEMGMEDEALDTFSKLLVLNLENAEVFYNKGNVLYHLERHNEALRAFDNALARDPHMAKAYYNKGIIFYHLKKYNEALGAFNKALAENPQMAEAYHHKGVISYRLKKYEEALNFFDIALNINPSYSEVWLNKGIINLLLGMINNNQHKYGESVSCYYKAIDALNEATEVKHNFVEAWSIKAIAYSVYSDQDEALEAFEKALTIKPDDPNLWYNKGLHHSNLFSSNHILDDNEPFDDEFDDEFNMAVEAFDKAINSDPNFINALYKKGHLFYKCKKAHEALEIFEDIIIRYPEFTKALYGKGIIIRDCWFEAMEAFENASKEFKTFNNLIKMIPHEDVTNSIVNLLKYVIYLDRESEGLLKKAKEKNPDIEWEWIVDQIKNDDFILDIYDKSIHSVCEDIILFTESVPYCCKNQLIPHILEQHNKNLNYYTGVLKFNPNDTHLWCEKGITHLELDQFYEALDSFTTALNLDINCFDALYGKGVVLSELEKFDEALETFEAALCLNSESTEAWYKKASLLSDLGRYEEALKSLDKALNIDPNISEMWFKRGCVLYNIERYEDSLKAFDYSLSGQGCELRKKKESAIKAIEGAASILDNFKTRIQAHTQRSEKKVQLSKSDINNAVSDSINRLISDVNLNEVFEYYYKPRINTDLDVSAAISYIDSVIFELKELSYSLQKGSFFELDNIFVQTLNKILDLHIRYIDEKDSNEYKLYKSRIDKRSLSNTNIKKIAVDAGSGLTFEDFVNSRFKGISIVMQLSIADDELMLYEYYKKDDRFVPNLRHDGFGYKSEYSKLENWFSNNFFELLRERISSNYVDQFCTNDYKEVEADFFKFYSSFNEIAPRLSSEQLNEVYFVTDDINGSVLFLKKVIRDLSFSCEAVDIIGNMFVPGSAMFFLELYVLFKDNHLIESFQSKVAQTGLDEKLELMKRPLVLLAPWDHQKKAFEAWIKNNYNGIIQMATGTGKTLIGFLAIEALYNYKTDGVVRILAHSKAILNQWRREAISKLGLIANLNNEYTTPIIYKKFTIYFNTSQSVSKDPNRYPADLLIADEVHHDAAPMFSKALSIKCNWKLGLSATIEGERSNILEKKLGPIIYNFSIKDALETGVLPRFEWKLHAVYLTIEEKVEFDKISKKIVELFNYIKYDTQTIKKVTDKELVLDDLYDFVKVIEVARYKSIDLPDNWKQLQIDIIQRRWILHRSRPKMDHAISLAKQYLSMKCKIVLFAMDIESCNFIAKELENDYDNVFLIHSLVKGNIYKIITEFKNADYGVLIGARMLDEGIDIPDAEIGINVSSSKTRLQLVQRIGRILRMKKGKKPIFHHYIALPEPASYLKEEDNLSVLDELSWVQDTALKMGVNVTTNIENEKIKELMQDAEKVARAKYTRTKETSLPSYGTVRLENILNQFSDHAIDKIISELERLDKINPNYQILDTEWTEIIRKAHKIVCEPLKKDGALEILDKNNPNYQIPDTEWEEIIRRAHQTVSKPLKEDEALDIRGYWWILILGDRNPAQIKEIFSRYLDNTKI